MRKGEEIYLCQPTYATPDRQSARQFWVRALKPQGPHSGMGVIQDNTGYSLLANAFNYHWANALNLQLAGRNVTRFVMLHDDIVPEDWWADKLLEELDETGADLLSVVVPIKDGRGLTSVAIDDSSDEWGVWRRLTMREVMKLPETFDAWDVWKCGLSDNHWTTDHPHRPIVVNTGCWACRFDRPWCSAGNPDGSLRVCFAIKDKIQRGAGGRYETVVMPEDWHFSRCLNGLGCRVMATRKIRLGHKGDLYYPNDNAWGEYTDGDRDLAHKWNHKGGAKPVVTEQNDGRQGTESWGGGTGVAPPASEPGGAVGPAVPCNDISRAPGHRKF